MSSEWRSAARLSARSGWTDGTPWAARKALMWRIAARSARSSRTAAPAGPAPTRASRSAANRNRVRVISSFRLGRPPTSASGDVRRPGGTGGAVSAGIASPRFPRDRRHPSGTYGVVSHNERSLACFRRAWVATCTAVGRRCGEYRLVACRPSRAATGSRPPAAASGPCATGSVSSTAGRSRRRTAGRSTSWSSPSSPSRRQTATATSPTCGSPRASVTGRRSATRPTRGRGGDPARRDHEGQVGPHPGDPARPADPPSLDHLEHMTVEAARDELCDLPGVGARPPPACCSSPTACATSRSTRTSRASAPGSASSGRARRSRSSTTPCSTSPRGARSTSSTSTSCVTAAVPATRSGRDAANATSGDVPGAAGSGRRATRPWYLELRDRRRSGPPAPARRSSASTRPTAA